MESKGLEPTDCEAFVALHHELYRCPRHPHAVLGEDIDDDGCRFCLSDGMRRHHARRKTEGRPIIPPRPKPKLAIVVTPSSAPPAAKTGKEKAREIRVSTALRFTPNDAPLKTETRLRVHVGCVTSADRVTGKYGPTPAAVCARCGLPAAEGKVVVTAVKNDGRLKELISRINLNSFEDP